LKYCFTYYSDFVYCQASLVDRFQHSFPTRRSSDLAALAAVQRTGPTFDHDRESLQGTAESIGEDWTDEQALVRNLVGFPIVIERSEEHTSELQSRENLVCRLLLEKKI